MEIPFNFSYQKYLYPWSLNFRNEEDTNNYRNITNFHKLIIIHLILYWMLFLIFLIITLQYEFYKSIENIIIIFSFLFISLLLRMLAKYIKNTLLLDIYFAFCILILNISIVERQISLMLERIKLNQTQEGILLTEDMIWRLIFIGVHIKIWHTFMNAAKLRWYIISFCDLLINCLILRHFICFFRINGTGSIILTEIIPSAILPIFVSFLDEKIYKGLIINLNRTKENLKSFETLIEKIIPNFIIIINTNEINESKIAYANSKAKNFFKSGEETEELFKKLLLIQIQGEANINLIDKCKMLINRCEKNSTLCNDFKKNEDFLNFEANYQNDMNQSFNFFINIGKMNWRNEKVILIILSDITFKIKLQNLKEINDYKDVLLATVSHDLRTPINSIICYLEMISEEVKNVSPRTLEYVNAVRCSSQLLLFMINDFLDYSQIVNKKFKLKNEMFYCIQMIENLSNIINIQIKKKKLSFKCEIDEIFKFKAIYGDVNRIQQILLNLLGNAIKFTMNGEINLSITYESCSYHGNTHKIATFMVKDSGIGIDELNILNIFLPFHKLESNLNLTGIGLGLSISQNLAKTMHDEGITVKSKKNVGSEFRFSIPLLEDEFSDCFSLLNENCSANQIKQRNFKTKCFLDKFFSISTGASSSQKDFDFDYLNKNHRILVVDDDIMTALIHKKFIEDFGFQCKSASNGYEAINIIINNQKISQFFSLILLDCNMPIMNGHELAKEIKKLIEKNVIPKCFFLFLTGNIINQNEDDRTFDEMSKNYLFKPVSKLKLKEKLLEVFQQS